VEVLAHLRQRLALLVSLDGARASTHDAWRGAGSFERALDGIADAQELGLPLRVAMTETPENRDEVEELRELLGGLGITGSAFAVRPLVRRGFAADEQSAVEVDDAVIAPELTVTADGVHWPPIGGEGYLGPDLVGARGRPPESPDWTPMRRSTPTPAAGSGQGGRSEQARSGPSTTTRAEGGRIWSLCRPRPDGGEPSCEG